MIAPTRDQLKNTEMYEASHLNGGDAWFGYLFQSKQFPRFQRMAKYIRKDKRTECTFLVDGDAVGPVVPASASGTLHPALLELALAAAVTALSAPPAVTPEEQAVLDRVPTEFCDLRELESELCDNEPRDEGMGPERSRIMGLLHGTLKNKGLIEYGKLPWPANYKPEITIDHRRWSPTIRRRAG